MSCEAVLADELEQAAAAARSDGFVTVTRGDRVEFGRALVIQGFAPLHAAERLAELYDTDGALQMMARHRINFELVSGPKWERVQALIDWARQHQAFPEGNPGGAGRGHIDERQRFALRDLVAALSFSTMSGR